MLIELVCFRLLLAFEEHYRELAWRKTREYISSRDHQAQRAFGSKLLWCCVVFPHSTEQSVGPLNKLNGSPTSAKGSEKECWPVAPGFEKRIDRRLDVLSGLANTVSNTTMSHSCFVDCAAADRWWLAPFEEGLQTSPFHLKVLNLLVKMFDTQYS